MKRNPAPTGLKADLQRGRTGDAGAVKRRCEPLSPEATMGVIRPRDIPVIEAGYEWTTEGGQHDQKRTVHMTVPRLPPVEQVTSRAEMAQNVRDVVRAMFHFEGVLSFCNAQNCHPARV